MDTPIDYGLAHAEVRQALDAGYHPIRFDGSEETRYVTREALAEHRAGGIDIEELKAGSVEAVPTT